MREAPRDRGGTGSRCGSASTYRLLGLSSTFCNPLPARFGHARDVAAERKLPKADPAELKLAQEAARAPADLAAVLRPSHELRLPLRLDDLGHVDLRKDHVIADAEGVVAAAVERLGRHAAEVAHPRQRDVDQAVEELVHLVAAQGDPRADR